MKNSVLIIDDNEQVRGEVRRILSESNLFTTIYEAMDGVEGFKTLLNKDVDLILCDVIMPGIDGFKFLSMKKARPEFNDIPVIMLTAIDDEQSKVIGLRGGADDYVPKPFSPLELAARVRVILDRVGRSHSMDKEGGKEGVRLEQIPVQKGDTIKLIPIEDIFFIDTKHEYANLHTYSDSYLTTYSLSELEKVLDKKTFFRTHRSFIVNLKKVNQIVKISRNSLIVTLNDESESRVPVSRRQASALREVLGI